MTASLEELLAAYIAAWCAADPDKRMALLQTAWAEDGTYRDPNSEAAGRAALSALIGRMHARFPGARIELTSGISTHHGQIHFAWRMVAADGSVRIEGVDFGTLAADGRLRQIVGFFGPPPPLP